MGKCLTLLPTGTEANDGYYFGLENEYQTEVVQRAMLVDISHGIQVAGFHYDVDMSAATHQRLIANSDYGSCDCLNKVIEVDCMVDPEQRSKTFLHEVLEALNHVYCNNKLEHEKIEQLSFGLHQVCVSLGLRFGNGENAEL